MSNTPGGDTTIKRLQVVLTGNTRQLQQAMSQAQQVTSQTETSIKSSMDKVGTTLKRVGTVVAAALSVKATVLNPDGRYSGLFADGSEIKVYVGYGRTAATATYDLLCTVYAYGATSRMSSIAVKCYDGLRKADKTKWTAYTFPATAGQIIQSAAAEAGIAISSLPANGSDIPVDLRDDEGKQPELSMTCRQAIAAALLISGNYGRMTADGRLHCGWYTDQADVSVKTNWLLDYTVTDSQTYTGVQVYGQEITGDASRLYKLSSGQFVTEANCAAIQARLYDALVGLPVCQATVKMILDPTIPAGVMLAVTYPQAGSSVTARIPITSVSIHGGMSATYSCDAITADEADDLRAPEQGTVEDVAQGSYATKDYVDAAIKNSSGGGSGGSNGFVTLFVPEGSFSKDNSLFVATESGIAKQLYTVASIKQQAVTIPSRDEVARLAEIAGKSYHEIWFPVHLRAGVDNYSGYATIYCHYEDYSADTPGDRIMFGDGQITVCLSSRIISGQFSIGRNLRRDKANYPTTDGWYWY